MIYIRSVKIKCDAQVLVEANKIKADWIILEEISKINDLNPCHDSDYCLSAVCQNGQALQFIKEQCLEICLAAVEEDPNALRFVNN